ncbi:hypothetical protein [Micromonospora sp. NPDC050276]|uniref:hypothetical protein n=1 Tax=Micromonospora sp. NPDC050276 TaxID=3364278 RepID=UPI0037B67162
MTRHAAKMVSSQGIHDLHFGSTDNTLPTWINDPTSIDATVPVRCGERRESCMEIAPSGLREFQHPDPPVKSRLLFL